MKCPSFEGQACDTPVCLQEGKCHYTGTALAATQPACGGIPARCCDPNCGPRCRLTEGPVALEPGWLAEEGQRAQSAFAARTALAAPYKPADLYAQVAFVARVNGILDDVRYKSWVIQAYSDYGAGAYLQTSFHAPDHSKHRQGYANPAVQQSGRKWRLSEHMTKSEIVQTALMAVMAAEEHESREQFLYKGRAIFGPHFDVDGLHDICGRKGFEDMRPEPRAAAPVPRTAIRRAFAAVAPEPTTSFHPIGSMNPVHVPPWHSPRRRKTVIVDPGMA